MKNLWKSLKTSFSKSKEKLFSGSGSNRKNEFPFCEKMRFFSKSVDPIEDNISVDSVINNRKPKEECKIDLKVDEKFKLEEK